MHIRTTKQGVVMAIVDGEEYPIFAKGENSHEAIREGAETILGLLTKDAAIEAAKVALEAARNGGVPVQTSIPMVSQDHEPDPARPIQNDERDESVNLEDIPVMGDF